MRRDIRASSQPDLGLESIRRFAVPLPPPQEQREIERLVDALLALAHRIEQRVTEGTGRAEKLTQSVLARAFRGELNQSHSGIYMLVSTASAGFIAALV